MFLATFAQSSAGIPKEQEEIKYCNTQSSPLKKQEELYGG